MEKRAMKYIGSLLAIVACLGATARVQGQVDKITVTVAPAGQYLEFPAMPTSGQVLTLERSSGQGFEVIAHIHPPGTRDVLYQRIAENSQKLPVYQGITQALSDTLWTIYRSGQLDDIQTERSPAVRMAFGAAFLDTLPMPRAYRATLGEQRWSVETKDLRLPASTTGRITLKDYTPDPRVQRAIWQFSDADYPALVKAYRQKVGIDSAFHEFDAVIGIERDSSGMLNLNLSDTTVFHGIVYHYHLKGFDPLGNLLTVSDTVRMGAAERAVGQFNLRAGPAPTKDGIRLAWDRMEGQHAIRAIRVFRSHTYDGDYLQQAILPPGDTSWVDRGAGSGVNYYYQLVSQGTQGASFPSIRVFGKYDSQKPVSDVPVIVTATLQDSTVRVAWTFEGFSDVYGFRVYRSAGLSGAFEPISDVLAFEMGVADYHVFDGPHTLVAGEYYTYAVTALNRNQLETRRVVSDALQITRSGALATPLQVRVVAINDTTASISWQEMSEESPGIIGYQVYRKSVASAADEPFVRVNEELIRFDNAYQDVTGPGSAWQYAVRSVGLSDSSAYSLPVVFRSEIRKPLPPGRIRVYRQGDGVLVNWDGTANPRITSYHVYRGSGDGEATRVTTVPTRDNALAYLDKGVKKGTAYFYYVTTENDQGVESDGSDELVIRL